MLFRREELVMGKKTKGFSKKSATIANPGLFSSDDRQKLRGQKEIAENRLERFANRTTKRPYMIEFFTPEFTCLCPKTGFPDFASLLIRYVPGEWCVELKSLKLYINHFRDQHVFHEDVTNHILDDLVELLDPQWMEVLADFNVRGNIKTVIRAEHSKKNFRPQAPVPAGIMTPQTINGGA
jgi:7-cyano-7-deazaguanine reductase